MAMQWRSVLAYVGFVLVAWAALAVWQWHEYGHERDSARNALHRQAESLTNALVGGIKYHRRMGRFFEEQLRATLEVLAESEDILAVAIACEGGKPLLSAGDTELLGAPPSTVPGEFWEHTGLRSVVDFHLEPQAAGDRSGGGGRGFGLGGGGRGFGRGARRQAVEEDDSPFSAGGQFAAILLLDRSHTDALCRRAFWLRLWLVVAGGMVLVFVGLAWLATVWMVEARGRARVLESETRHLRDLGQAAAGLAHETRNPLGLIRGWTQRLAQSDLPSPEQHKQAQTIVEECDRVTARINQFLAFARPRQPSLEPVELSRVVDELADVLEPDLDAKGLKLHRTAGEPCRPVRGDREMLRQALFNLIRNAIQFSPEDGTVEISVVSGQDGRCRIEVADRGPGVPEDKVESLFSPYFTTRPDGTGLGLAIVRRIAAAHGWQAGYTPRPAGGSIFWMDRIHG